ncbi:hypothetical protein JCM3765_003041 [Sporobolomyces pararoseus]
MNFLSSLSNAVISASSQALQSATSQIPGVSGYTLGDKVQDFNNSGKSIWTLYNGVKRDDQSQVSIFSFELNSPNNNNTSRGGGDRKLYLQLAKNCFKKLRSTRHPNVLKFLQGSESDHSVWLITEPVTPLTTIVDNLSLEEKVYGLLHITTALGFLNNNSGNGSTLHGGLRFDNSVWVTKSGEWKLGGFEISTQDLESSPPLQQVVPQDFHEGYLSPEVLQNGWNCLNGEYDKSVYDSWLLHLFIYQLFNNSSSSSLPSSSTTTSLTSIPRGQIPMNMFQPWKRLGSQNPLSRLKTFQFLELGNSLSDTSNGGWWTQNRLVKLSTALDNFSLSSENEQTSLIRTLKAIASSSSSTTTDSEALPSGFLLYKILPSLLHTFEFSSSSLTSPPPPPPPSSTNSPSPQSSSSSCSISSSSLLPLILSLSTKLPKQDFKSLVIPPILRMFQLPDRSMRMILLETLDQYFGELTEKQVNEKIWPFLITGFGDLVPIIREVTVKSILILAPKLSDRILNNDLLRYLSKTLTDTDSGIRTNTCILLSRLSPYLSSSTKSKVLIPAFSKSLRDPFIHCRIAGLMSLMAGLESWEKEDLACKVIPSVGICLIDKEKLVRDQGFKAIDMFVKKCEQLTASMPETVLPHTTTTTTSTNTPILNNNNGVGSSSVGLATNAASAAGVLANWAFGNQSSSSSSTTSVEKRLSKVESSTPINDDRRVSTPTTTTIDTPSNGLPGGFGFEPQTNTTDTTTQDWGGDLMDVNDDTEDWDEFETGQQQRQQQSKKTTIRKVDPLTARLSSSSKSKSSSLVAGSGGVGGGGRKIGTGTGTGSSMRLGSASKSSALRVPMDMDATDSWDLDFNEDETTTTPTTTTTRAVSATPRSLVNKPKLSAMDPSLLSIASSTKPPPPPARKSIPLKQSTPTTTTTTTKTTMISHSPTISNVSNPSSPSSSSSIINTTTTSFQPPPPPPPAAPPRSVSPAPSNPWKDEISSPPPPPPLSPPPPPVIPIPEISVIPSPPASSIATPPPQILESSSSFSRPSTPTLTGGTVGGGGMTKEEKAIKMALAREERRKRMAAAKVGI